MGVEDPAATPVQEEPATDAVPETELPADPTFAAPPENYPVLPDLGTGETPGAIDAAEPSATPDPMAAYGDFPPPEGDADLPDLSGDAIGQEVPAVPETLGAVPGEYPIEAEPGAMAEPPPQDGAPDPYSAGLPPMAMPADEPPAARHDDEPPAAMHDEAPPADLSVRPSAIQDGTPPNPPPAPGGVIDVTLGDRLPEGPRSDALAVDVQAPQTFNVNLKMRAVVTVRNDGRDDALFVIVRLPLPAGVEFVESSPAPDRREDSDRTLAWDWGTLPAGAVRTIDLIVKPSEDGPVDLVAGVSSMLAAKARTAVQQPVLKIDQSGPTGEVIRGTTVDMNVVLQNVGSGPARDITLRATLSSGLQGFDENGEPCDARVFEQMIGSLDPNQSSQRLSLPVFAARDGDQTITIEAISDDVVPPAEKNTAPLTVVAPQLNVEVVGPDSRPVGSMAEYVITVTNTGSTAAHDVAVGAFAPLSGKLEPTPGDATIDADDAKGLHKIYWRLPRLDKGETKQFRLPIRLMKIQPYTVQIAANAQGPLEGTRLETERAMQSTAVSGIADVKVVDVIRRDQVVDVNGTTQFEIRIKNDGSTDAFGVQVDVLTSEKLQVVDSEPLIRSNPQDPHHYGFDPPIDRLAPGAERNFTVTVKAIDPGIANLQVKVFWDGLDEALAVPTGSILRISEAPSGSTPR